MSRVAYIATVVSSTKNTPPVDFVRKISFDDSDCRSLEFELTAALHKSLKYRENTVHIITSTTTDTNHLQLIQWLKSKKPNIEFTWFRSTQEYMKSLHLCSRELFDDIPVVWRFASFHIPLIIVSEISLRPNLPTQKDAMTNYLLNSVRYDLPTKLFSIRPPRYIHQTAILLVNRVATRTLAMDLYDSLLPYRPPLWDQDKLENWLMYAKYYCL